MIQEPSDKREADLKKTPDPFVLPDGTPFVPLGLIGVALGAEEFGELLMDFQQPRIDPHRREQRRLVGGVVSKFVFAGCEHHPVHMLSPQSGESMQSGHGFRISSGTEVRVCDQEPGVGAILPGDVLVFERTFGQRLIVSQFQNEPEPAQ